MTFGERGWVSAILWGKCHQPMCLLGRGFLWMRRTTRILSGFSMWTTAGVTGQKSRPPAGAPPQLAALQPVGAEGERGRHASSKAMTRTWPRHLSSQLEDPSKLMWPSWPHRDQPGYCWGQVPHPKLGRSGDWVLVPCPVVSASGAVLTDMDRHTPGFAGSLAPSPHTPSHLPRFCITGLSHN